MASLQSRSGPDIVLRRPTWDDVPFMFEIGRDPLACEMAGVKPRTREAFMARWQEIFADHRIHTQVIDLILDGDGTRAFAGSISVFQAPGETRDSIGYWIDRTYWGMGIASRAVARFLEIEPRRPLHATAAMTNLASLRVLSKNGFRLIRQQQSPETDRYMAGETGEFILE